jgi:hypothetical protein
MKILSLIAALGFVLVLCAGAQGADIISHDLARGVALGNSRYVAANGSVGIRIKWIGKASTAAMIAGNTAPTIQVDGSGNLLFTTNGSTADTTVDVTGTITVSGLTWGQVVGFIKASTNWTCVLVDVCPSWSASGVLATAAKSAGGAAEDADGIDFKITTTAQNRISACLGIEWMPDTVKHVPNGILHNQRSTPYETAGGLWRNELVYCKANATVTTGPLTLSVWAVKSDAAGATELLLWQQAGAASTVDSTLDLTSIWDYDTGQPMTVNAPPGWRIVVAYTSAAASDISAGTIQVHGLSWRE